MSTLTSSAIDGIIARMDAAYAERRKHKPGTPGYVAADAAIEAVYADLRALNGAWGESVGKCTCSLTPGEPNPDCQQHGMCAHYGHPCHCGAIEGASR